LQELSLSAIGSVASAVDAAILPFFPTILEKLKMYLLETPADLTLQVQSIRKSSDIFFQTKFFACFFSGIFFLLRLLGTNTLHPVYMFSLGASQFSA